MYFIKVFVKIILNYIFMLLVFFVFGDLLEWRYCKEKFLLLKYYYIKIWNFYVIVEKVIDVRKWIKEYWIELWIV